MYSIRQFSAFYSHFQVTSGQMTSSSGSLPFTWGHVTSFSVTWLPPPASHRLCRKWNVQNTPVFGLLQPLSGDFRSNDVISRALPVTWGHVTSFPVSLLPHPAIYSLIGSEMYGKRQFLTFYSHFQVASCQMTPLPGHFMSPEVTWRHLLSRDCLLVRATGL